MTLEHLSLDTYPYMTLDILKVLTPTVISFLVGIGVTPLVTHYLYKYKCWKKKSVALATDGSSASLSQQLHNDEERKTPRMGGLIIVIATFASVAFFWIVSYLDSGGPSGKLDFLSRSQTWLPFATFLIGGLIGFIDDYFTIRESYDHIAGGLSLAKRLVLVTLVGLFGAWWFYSKLDISSVFVPFIGTFNIGWLFVPFFVAVMLGSYSGGVIDGLDGLSGGVYVSIFSAYGAIAFTQNQIDLSAFCFVVVGALLAFLWFNIPPARFFMSETGIMAITLSLAVVAFLTNQPLLLIVIAFLPLVTSLSSSIQLASKKLRNGKKVFLVAPLHHHFQALGWPAHKVVMRYWVISAVCAVIGVLIALMG